MDVQQNKIAYVTGSSRGIGNAIVHELLLNDYKVFGISRTNTIEHPNFEFIELDLGNISAVKNFQFNPSASDVVLINNAGTIGEIKPLGSVSDDSIEKVANINIVAPQILMNRFISRYQSEVKNGHILNISSGAGKYPIDAWATYCASKAAIDLYSLTAQDEWTNRDIKNWHIHSVAPGVVDTEMQKEIRNSNPDDFKLHAKFESLKEEAKLSTPSVVARKICKIIAEPNQFTEVIVSVRDM